MSVSSSSKTKDSFIIAEKLSPGHILIKNGKNRYFNYVCVINNLIYYDLQSEHFCKSKENQFVPDHVTFSNQVTYLGNLVQTELPIERKPNQITFGWTVLPSLDSPVFPQMQIAKEAPLK